MDDVDMEDDNVAAARTFIDSLNDNAAGKLQGLEALFLEVEG